MVHVHYIAYAGIHVPGARHCAVYAVIRAWSDVLDLRVQTLSELLQLQLRALELFPFLGQFESELADLGLEFLANSQCNACASVRSARKHVSCARTSCETDETPQT